MKQQIGIVGLGKMGSGIARQLLNKNYDVYGFNRTTSVAEEHAQYGLKPCMSLKELVGKLQSPRIVWVMLTAGEPTEQIITGENGLINLLAEGDIVIDAANSFYKNSEKMGTELTKKRIEFLGAGVSGGPSGAINGACIMVGGKIETYKKTENIFKDLTLQDALSFFEGFGAGHFVKMVHNGIEYGIMQSIGEGFNILNESKYNLNLTEVARLYQHGSVIESRLIGWLYEGYKKYGEDLTDISGSVEHSGEGQWTVETANEMALPAPVIKESLNFRIQSQNQPSYIGKVVSVLRNMFGGHKVSNA